MATPAELEREANNSFTANSAGLQELSTAADEAVVELGDIKDELVDEHARLRNVIHQRSEDAEGIGVFGLELTGSRDVQNQLALLDVPAPDGQLKDLIDSKIASLNEHKTKLEEGLNAAQDLAKALVDFDRNGGTPSLSGWHKAAYDIFRGGVSYDPANPEHVEAMQKIAVAARSTDPAAYQGRSNEQLFSDLVSWHNGSPGNADMQRVMTSMAKNLFQSEVTNLQNAHGRQIQVLQGDVAQLQTQQEEQYRQIRNQLSQYRVKGDQLDYTNSGPTSLISFKDRAGLYAFISSEEQRAAEINANPSKWTTSAGKPLEATVIKGVGLAVREKGSDMKWQVVAPSNTDLSFLAGSAVPTIVEGGLSALGWFIKGAGIIAAPATFGLSIPLAFAASGLLAAAGEFGTQLVGAAFGYRTSASNSQDNGSGLINFSDIAVSFVSGMAFPAAGGAFEKIFKATGLGKAALAGVENADVAPDSLGWGEGLIGQRLRNFRSQPFSNHSPAGLVGRTMLEGALLPFSVAASIGRPFYSRWQTSTIANQVAKSGFTIREARELLSLDDRFVAGAPKKLEKMDAVELRDWFIHVESKIREQDRKIATRFIGKETRESWAKLKATIIAQADTLDSARKAQNIYAPHVKALGIESLDDFNKHGFSGAFRALDRNGLETLVRHMDLGRIENTSPRISNLIGTGSLEQRMSRLSDDKLSKIFAELPPNDARLALTGLSDDILENIFSSISGKSREQIKSQFGDQAGKKFLAALGDYEFSTFLARLDPASLDTVMGALPVDNARRVFYEMPDHVIDALTRGTGGGTVAERRMDLISASSANFHAMIDDLNLEALTDPSIVSDEVLDRVINSNLQGQVSNRLGADVKRAISEVETRVMSVNIRNEVIEQFRADMGDIITREQGQYGVKYETTEEYRDMVNRTYAALKHKLAVSGEFSDANAMRATLNAAAQVRKEFTEENTIVFVGSDGKLVSIRAGEGSVLNQDATDITNQTTLSAVKESVRIRERDLAQNADYGLGTQALDRNLVRDTVREQWELRVNPTNGFSVSKVQRELDNVQNALRSTTPSSGTDVAVPGSGGRAAAQPVKDQAINDLSRHVSTKFSNDLLFSRLKEVAEGALTEEQANRVVAHLFSNSAFINGIGRIDNAAKAFISTSLIKSSGELTDLGEEIFQKALTAPNVRVGTANGLVSDGLLNQVAEELFSSNALAGLQDTATQALRFTATLPGGGVREFNLANKMDLVAYHDLFCPKTNKSKS